MAVTSGSFDTTHRISGSYNTYATFSWWVNSTDTSGTTIGWSLTGKTASSYQYIAATVSSVVINGSQVASGWSGNMYNGTVMASGTTKISHSAEYTFSASATITMYNSTQYSGSGSWTLAAVATAPSGLTATLSTSQLTDTTAQIVVNLDSYGSPSSASGRYIEAAVLGSNSYGSPYRCTAASNVTSATLTVNNSSKTDSSNPLTIVPNTKYWYGAYATNTVVSSSTVVASFVTRPAYITGVMVQDSGSTDKIISVVRAEEGSAYTVYTEYSYDQETWTTAQDTFHLEVTAATTIYIRRRSDAGVTNTCTLSLTPTVSPKLYCPVLGQAKEVKKFYGSVNGKAVRISKVYGSSGGKTKLVYVDNS